MTPGRVQLDAEIIDRLRARGWGARRIAKYVGTSRSTIRRYLIGRRTPEGIPSTSTAPLGPVGGPRPPAVARTGREQARLGADPRARHAQSLTRAFQAGPPDRDRHAAECMRSAFLDGRPHATAWVAVDDALRQLRREREDRRRAAEVAAFDLRRHWRDEVALLSVRAAQLSVRGRADLRRAADGEERRLAELLARRLADGTSYVSPTELVDRLLADGVKRLAATLAALLGGSNDAGR